MSRRKYPSETQKGSTVGRARSTLSVSAVDYYLSLPVSTPPSPAISTVTLTPGRIRNIDQDMEALRASRQDNPFIQQVIASRESLIDSLEEESDNTNLMAKELSIDLDVDPLSLPEMHEHMIRSPPPTNWPVFQFPNLGRGSGAVGDEETLQVEVDEKNHKAKHSSWDGSSDSSPLRSLSTKSHHHHHHHHQDMFSLLTPNSLRSSSGEDSIHLMAED